MRIEYNNGEIREIPTQEKYDVYVREGHQSEMSQEEILSYAGREELVTETIMLEDLSLVPLNSIKRIALN